jgi:hypothetical protein
LRKKVEKNREKSRKFWIIREQLATNQKNARKSLLFSQKLSKSLFLMLKIKHFENKIAQKTKVESPLENFIIIYTEMSQKKNSVKNEIICIILSALWIEK